ncbi:MAG: DUF4860 domain-containing protein [Lachnospiraceae bacterium]|nr:DUF4860 domain-containing protein [Lachnospiraceae bacterium]
MNFRRRGRSIVDMLFILALFAVFMISTLFIVLFGAKIYQKIIADSDTNFISRTSIAYISEKIHQHDERGGVTVIYNGDEPVLRLSETYGGSMYYTYLYEQNNVLKEITCPAEYEPVYSAGQQILEVTSFNVEPKNDNLYRFQIKDIEENEITFFVSVNSDNM